jgi:hypothetical protein
MRQTPVHELPFFRRRRRRRRRWGALGLVLVGAALLSAYVHNVIVIEERLRQIAALQRACDSLESVVAYRRQQLVQQEAPEVIIPRAQQLGLELPTVPPRVVP